MGTRTASPYRRSVHPKAVLTRHFKRRRHLKQDRGNISNLHCRASIYGHWIVIEEESLSFTAHAPRMHRMRSFHGPVALLFPERNLSIDVAVILEDEEFPRSGRKVVENLLLEFLVTKKWKVSYHRPSSLRGVKIRDP